MSLFISNTLLCIVPTCPWRIKVGEDDIGTPLAEDYRAHLRTHTRDELADGVEIDAAGLIAGSQAMKGST